jgi:hypothetical protein
MERRQLLAAGVAAAGVAASATPSRAQASKSRDLVGSWFSTITATNPPLPPFHSLISFYTDGVVTESISYFFPFPPPLGNLLFTTFHGGWEPTGDHTFEVFLRGLVQKADTGAPIGTDNVRLSLRLDQDAGTLTGTFKTQLKSTDGTVLLAITGDYSATPITV